MGAAACLTIESMFDSYPAPSRSLNQEVPSDWPVLLNQADAPTEDDQCSTRRRDALVAMRGGSWQEAVVWAWTWNSTGRPVHWRCQVEIGGHVAWYEYVDALIRTSDPR